MNLIKKFRLQTQNGKLSDDDFVGDAPPIGSSDARYSKADTEELMKLADELKAKRTK